MFSSTRLLVGVGLAGVLVVPLACGKDVRYQLPAAPPTAVSTTSVTTTPRPTAARRVTTSAGEGSASPDGTASGPTTTAARFPWSDVTANLTGLPSECGTVSFVWARPDRDEVIAGVAQQGMWVSRDGAPEWIVFAKGNVITNRTTGILLDPAAPQTTFYQSGLYGATGAYVTTDAGASYRALSPVPGVDQLAVDFADPARNTILLVAHEQLDLQRTTNGGKTWTNVAATMPATAGLGRSIALVDKDTYLYGTYRGTEAGIYRTTDGGATWTLVVSGASSGPALVRADGSIWFVTEGVAGIVKTTDGGANWTQVVRSGVMSPFLPTLVELPDGRLAGFGRSVVVSADDGKTWKAVGSGIPFPPAGLAYAPIRKAFYLWRIDCASGEIPIPENSIITMPFDYTSS